MSVIAQVGLCAARAFAAPPADLPIVFDARSNSLQPLVRISAFGRSRNVLLDTGSYLDAFRPRSAGVSTSVVEAKGLVLGADFSGRPIIGIRVPVLDLRLPDGWPSLGNEMILTPWVDRVANGGFFDPGGPHIDGVLAPIHLAGAERVVIIDFNAATLSIGSWKDAEKRMGGVELALTASAVPVADTKLVVIALVDGRLKRMALDTGASRSALFPPREADLPAGLSRVATRPMSVRVGQVEATVPLDVIEMVETIGDRY